MWSTYRAGAIRRGFLVKCREVLREVLVWPDPSMVASASGCSRGSRWCGSAPDWDLGSHWRLRLAQQGGRVRPGSAPANHVAQPVFAKESPLEPCRGFRWLGTARSNLSSLACFSFSYLEIVLRVRNPMREFPASSSTNPFRRARHSTALNGQTIDWVVLGCKWRARPGSFGRCRSVERRVPQCFAALYELRNGRRPGF